MLALVKKPQNISNVMTQSFARMVNGVARNIQMTVSSKFSLMQLRFSICSFLLSTQRQSLYIKIIHLCILPRLATVAIELLQYRPIFSMSRIFEPSFKTIILQYQQTNIRHGINK